MGLFGSNDVKRYYGVIYDLLSHTKYLTKEGIQAYFRATYGEECKDKALDKALSKFEKEVKKHHTFYTLTQRQFLKNSKGYTTFLDELEILDICFAAYKAEIKALFEKELDALVDNPSFGTLVHRVGFLERSKAFRTDDVDGLIKMAGKAMGEVMVERFGVSDPTVRALVVEAVCKSLRIDHKYTAVYAAALRARYYAAFSDDEEYCSITLEDCRRAVLQFCEGEEPTAYYVDENAEKVYKHPIFVNTTRIDWRHWAGKDLRFLDGACYCAVSDMAEQLEDSDTSSVEDCVDVIVAYLSDE